MKKILFVLCVPFLFEMNAGAGEPFKKRSATWEQYLKALRAADSDSVKWQSYMTAKPSVILAEYAVRLDKVDEVEGDQYKPFTPGQVLFVLNSDSFTKTEKLTWKEGEMAIGYITGGRVDYWRRANYNGAAGEQVKMFLGWPVVSTECGNSMEYVAMTATFTSEPGQAHAFVPPQQQQRQNSDQSGQLWSSAPQRIPDATLTTNGFEDPMVRNARAELDATTAWLKARYTNNPPVIGPTGVRVYYPSYYYPSYYGYGPRVGVNVNVGFGFGW